MRAASRLSADVRFGSDTPNLFQHAAACIRTNSNNLPGTLEANPVMIPPRHHYALLLTPLKKLNAAFQLQCVFCKVTARWSVHVCYQGVVKCAYWGNIHVSIYQLTGAAEDIYGRCSASWTVCGFLIVLAVFLHRLKAIRSLSTTRQTSSRDCSA